MTSTNEAKIVFKGILTIELGKNKIYAELAQIINSGFMYGKKKVTLKDNFYFYYPSKNMKAIVGFEKSDKGKDVLKGGIYRFNKKILLK